MGIKIKIQCLNGRVVPDLDLDSKTTIRDMVKEVKSQLGFEADDDVKVIKSGKIMDASSTKPITICGFGGNNQKKQFDVVTVVSRLRGGGGVLNEIVKQFKHLSEKARKPNVAGLECNEEELSIKFLYRGPKGSPYHTGMFWVKIVYPTDYPATIPKIVFLTTIFHPNVYYDSGNVCWSDDDISGARKADLLIDGLSVLMYSPNPDSPANTEAATLMRTDMRAFNRRVQEDIELYAEH